MSVRSTNTLLSLQARVKEVPEDWKINRVGEVLKICNQYRRPISQEIRATVPGVFPYYGPTKIQGYINEYEQDGDFVLIGEDGDHFLKYDRVPQTQLVSGKCTVNNHAHVIAPTEKCTIEWFDAFFKHRNIINFLSRQGAGRYKLNKAGLEKLPILLPPLPEQKKIATILSTWDEAIATTEKLLANSERIKKSLDQLLLTGISRTSSFKGRGHAQTRYGQIPDDWRFVQIGEVAQPLSQRNNERKETPVLSCSKHVGFVHSLAYFKKKVYSDDTSNYIEVPRGAFGFPSNHIEEGSIGYQDIVDLGIVSPIYTVFKTNGEVNDHYLFKLLKTEHYRQIFSAATNSSVDRRGNLRWKEFAKIHVPLPTLAEQNAISDRIKAAEQICESHALQLESLKRQKSALMQQLLTGKRRVPIEGSNQ